MSDYFTARKLRFERNQADLIQLIKDVQLIDNTVEAYVHSDYPKRFMERVTFIRGEEINTIRFHEVPYRWSGCGYSENHNSHWGGENSKMPFTAEDVIKTFQPIKGLRKSQVELFKDKEHYLKWCSYLKKYER